MYARGGKWSRRNEQLHGGGLPPSALSSIVKKGAIAFLY
jgi:hypothetical protein